MTAFTPCPAPGVMHMGAHLTHIPAHMRGTELQTYDAIRAAGIMCPVCEGNGVVSRD